MRSVLITQCLQQDFVKPIQSGEPLPNALHIGHFEAKRLVGEEPSSGPVQRFMAWANAASALEIIHIRDWHDPEAIDQAAHLQHFGSHCLQHSPGAEFIFERPVSRDALVINSTTLNDFEGTNLKAHLDALASDSATNSKSVRVGIIGVWTEAKILFLAYELSTRYPNWCIAVCSALTASSSRSRHFLALQQLQRVVGVRVIDSLGEFAQFLGGQWSALPTGIDQALQVNTSDNVALSQVQDQLLRYLFRDCQSLSLQILDGGFSGNLVARATGVDAHGHEQAPHVVKIGARELMAKERMAFEQIEMVLGNNAPAIAEYADFNDFGAIKYRYAAMGAGKTKSFQGLYQGGAPLRKIQAHLEAVFIQQLGKLYRAAVLEKQDLLAYYCFSDQWAESVKNKVADLLGNCPNAGLLTLPGEVSIPNLYGFYLCGLANMPSAVDDFPVGFVHGDLNGANIIIDERENVWIIDFFHTHRGHILKDFAKLENDVLYIYTEIETLADLKLAYRFTDFLLAHTNPLELLSPLPHYFSGTPFDRCYQVINMIRQLARNYQAGNAATLRLQWLLPQLRYAVHTLGFDEPNKLQRTWALYTAGKIVQLLQAGA